MNNVLKALLLLLSFPLMAQYPGCGQNQAYGRLFEQDPSARSRFEKITQNSQSGYLSKNQAASSFTIPVVFHVLHQGGAENITDAQIQDAMAILNRDYRRLNADTSDIVTEYKNIAADCNIQFSLATTDDIGNCTNGITRHYDSRANWTINMQDYVYTWNSSKYMNIYVVKSLPPGIAGYAYLPGTVPPNADAIVILNNFIGSIGTGDAYTSRALTHEVGHWLSLSHTWGNTNNPGVACGDDGVNDTPLTKGHGSCNLNNAVDCTPGIVENIQNYMEYAYCSRMFTQDQRTRMHNCLNAGPMNRANLSSNANLMATGVINPQTNCAPKADFIYVNDLSCIGNGLSFIDQSYNAPATSWLWSSPSATNVSILQNSYLVFANSGTTSVKLKASNAFGSDSIVKSPLTILSAPSAPGSLNIFESFESGNFPDNNWIATKAQYGSAFALSSSVAATGTNCMWVNNYFDNPSATVNFYTPAYNFHAMETGQMSFKYAYAQQNFQNNDRLRLYISNNCGASWNILYSAAGASLSTTGSFVTGPFNPGVSQWRTVSADIMPYSGSARVYFKFEFVPDPNGAGNNIFLDDISLNTVMGLKEFSALNSLKIYPNPFNEDLIIENNADEGVQSLEFYDISSRLIKKTDLKFERQTYISGLNELQPGVYFVKVKSASSQKTFKLIKQ